MISVITIGWLASQMPRVLRPHRSSNPTFLEPDRRGDLACIRVDPIFFSKKFRILSKMRKTPFWNINGYIILVHVHFLT